MECDLEIGGGDFEPIESLDIQSFTVPVGEAKKCMECQRQIASGASYTLVTGAIDDSSFEFFSCADCDAIASALYGDNSRVMGRLWPELEEDEESGFHRLTTGCIAKVEGATAKQYLRERWLKWKGLAA